MYISRMPLNIARMQAVQLVNSPYKMHAAIEQAFPPNALRSDDSGRILWRIDSTKNAKDGVWLYVVSPSKPDFTHIVEQAGWPSTTGWETKDYSPVLDSLAAGQVWQFRLKANPARKAMQNQGRRPNDKVVGTIQGHVTVEQQLTWLMDRCEKHGFEIATDSDGNRIITVTHRSIERYKHRDGKVTINTAVFDGVLIVRDSELFRKSLCCGIGRAKGFGCGLMTIAPLH